MKNICLKILEFIARIIPLRLYPFVLRRAHVDFFYHAVSDAPLEHARWLYSVVPLAQFSEALDYICARFTPVDYHQLHAHYTQGKSLPSSAAHLSFDDGFSECYSVVRPLLLKKKIPCTFFVATDWVDNQAMFYRNKISLCVDRIHQSTFNFQPSTLNQFTSEALATKAEVTQWLKELRLSDEALIDEICHTLGVDWQAFLQAAQPYLRRDQIRQMHAEGFVMGAHTKSHPKLRGLDAAEIEAQIVDSCRIVQEITGQAIVPFSFPHSAFGIPRQLLADIRARHPFVGLLFDTKGVHQDVEFIVNRAWAERPLTPARVLHPLPEILHNAYQEAWVDEIMGLGRKLRRL